MITKINDGEKFTCNICGHVAIYGAPMTYCTHLYPLTMSGTKHLSPIDKLTISQVAEPAHVNLIEKYTIKDYIKRRI
jgi:hypothetical protein